MAVKIDKTETQVAHDGGYTHLYQEHGLFFKRYLRMCDGKRVARISTTVGVKNFSGDTYTGHERACPVCYAGCPELVTPEGGIYPL